MKSVIIVIASLILIQSCLSFPTAEEELPDAVVTQPSPNAPAPEVSLGQIVEHLRSGANEHKESIPTVSQIEQSLAQLTKAADVTKHSRSEQNDTTEGVVATLRELLSKYLKDLVKHNKHDQAHIDYKWQMLKDGVHSEAGRAHGDILLAKTGWCDGRDELDESKGKMKDVYKYLVAVHQKFKKLAAVIRPVRPPQNGLPLPDSDISEVKQAVKKFEKTKPIYEKRARDYQDSLKKFQDAKDKHSTARQRWNAELKLESQAVKGNCTSATREYEDAKQEVKRNVNTRHKSYVSVRKLRCYVKHIRDPDAGNRCAAEKHQAADWKEHKDIVYKDLPLCKALQDLLAEFGPKEWKPNSDQCAALKSNEMAIKKVD